MVKKYKNGNKIVLISVIFIIMGMLISAFFMKSSVNVKYNTRDLINISTLDDEFMDNYLEDVRQIKTEDKENILIITSKKKLDETYGAFNVIEAPNNQYILQYNSETEKNNALKKFKKKKNIINVEENAVLNPETSTTTEYNSWGAVQLGYDDAINATDPSNLNQVTVAVVDTGVQMSEFNKYYAGKVVEVYDFFDPDTAVEELTDDKGHGTHVAGTIAESTPSNVKILPVRMADKEKTNNNMYLTDIVAAINEITKNKMADVINLSLGSHELGYFPTSLYNAIAGANVENIICVAAAGNANVSLPHYPSAFDNAISIAAVDSHLEKTVFSNYGETIDFASPGWNIKSLAVEPNSTVKSGTSMSAPHASAAVAILKSYNKDLTLEQTITLLKKYAIDISDNGWDQYYGYGVINFEGAKFCNTDVICDEYSVFAKDDTNTLSTIKITSPNIFTPHYNYGNLTNIMKAEINLYYNSNNYYTKNLEQLIKEIEIIGYDPFNYSVQNITIRYKGFETILKIDNRNLDSGWKYEELSDGTISITEMVYLSTEAQKLSYDYTDYPQVIYIPSKVDGKNVSNLSDDLFKDKDWIKRIYVSAGIQKLGKGMFGKSAVPTKTDFGPTEIIIPSSVNYINDATFENSHNIILRVYKDSYAESYAIENNIKYTYIDAIDVNMSATEYKAFETVETNGLSITVHYNGTEQSIEEITDGYKIEYANDNDSFRYGDTYFTIIFDTYFGYHVEQQVPVTVKKAIPEFTIPDNLVATIGQTLSEVELPSGFVWYDDSIELAEKGNHVFYAKYEMLDTVNYVIVDNIEIPILVKGVVIEPAFAMRDKTYNGLDDIPADCFVINNLDSSDYTIVSYTLSSIDVGKNTANVVLRLTDEKFKIYSLDGDLQEKEYVVNINIIPEVLSKPTLSVTKYTYNGENQTAIIDNFNEEKMNIIGNNRTDAGEQDILISLKNRNYIWDDNTYDDIIIKFIIDKAVPNILYTSSDNTVEYDGKSHGIKLDISSPSEVIVKYMDSNGEYTLDKMPTYTDIGEYTIKYRMYINSNYTDIIGEQNLKILKASIINNSLDYEGFYDGEEHTIKININITDYNIKYSVDNMNYDLEELPKFKDVGEYTINYKITSKNYNDLIGSNKIKIYGIKSFHPSALIKDNILIVRENIFLNITNKINTYALNTQYKHYDKNNLLLDTEVTKTGDILKINLNNSRDYTYFISVYGDINADGSVSSADYVKIRNHIMGAELIKDNIYFYASDVNNDNKITSADYVKIRKYIMNGGGL